MSELRLPSQRVCVVLLMRIGDVVWGMPIVNALKRDDPKRHITWVVQSVPVPLLQPHPSVNEVITFDRKKGLGELRALLVSVDTGPLHIARALDTPVIGLYGNTDPWRYGPYKAYEDLWIDRYNLEGPDEPAGTGVSIARAERMKLISVRDVLERVEVAKERYLLRKEAV